MNDLIALAQRPRRSTYGLCAAFIALFGLYILVRPEPRVAAADEPRPTPVYIVTTTSAVPITTSTVPRPTSSIPPSTTTTSTSAPSPSTSSSSTSTTAATTTSVP